VAAAPPLPPPASELLFALGKAETEAAALLALAAPELEPGGVTVTDAGGVTLGNAVLETEPGADGVEVDAALPLPLPLLVAAPDSDGVVAPLALAALVPVGDSAVDADGVAVAASEPDAVVLPVAVPDGERETTALPLREDGGESVLELVAVAAEDGDAVGVAVGHAVGELVGHAVGELVGDAGCDGDADSVRGAVPLGVPVRAADGDADGNAERLDVPLPVCAEDGDADGNAEMVGDAVAAGLLAAVTVRDGEEVAERDARRPCRDCTPRSKRSSSSSRCSGGGCVVHIKSSMKQEAQGVF